MFQLKIRNSGQNSTKTKDETQRDSHPLDIVWINVLWYLYGHLTTIYTLCACITQAIPWNFGCFLFLTIYGYTGSFGITLGAHRLFTHRSYKTNQIIRALLLLLQTIAGENSLYIWVRDHRVHHKFVDTNADPHNSKRGFFFSHIGWLMCKKHPDVKLYGAKVDMSDLEADPLIMWQHKYYAPLFIIFNFIVPISVGYFIFGLSLVDAWNVNISRYMAFLNCVWLVNSAAHYYGYKPYDKHFSSTDSHLIGLMSLGEGWHNYHHAFPWDYKTSELPIYFFNFSNIFLDVMAWLGWATDLKSASAEMIRKRIERTGDGSHDTVKVLECYQKEVIEKNIWGWDDTDMTEKDREHVNIEHLSVS